MKKYIKVFLFSFSLFCSIFFINSVSAMSFDDIYTDISNAAANDYYGEAFSGSSCPDTLYFPTKSRLLELLDSNIDSQEFSSYIANFPYYCIYNSSIYSNKVDILLFFYDDTNLNSVRWGDGPGYTFHSPSSSSYVYTTTQRNFIKLYYNISNNTYYFDTYTYNSSSSSVVNIGPSPKNLSQHFIFANFNVYYWSNTLSSSNNYTALINHTLSNTFTPPPLTIIDNPDSDILITYEYNQDYSNCHIDATIRNGVFSDKLFYSYQMPSISGQGLILGKTAFPSRRS